MADTSAQHAAEEWVVSYFLPDHFRGRSFAARQLLLKWGGQFAFDAVSDDGTVVGCVSTSESRTASGRSAIGKYQKLKADALYLLHVLGARQIFLVFTEDSMWNHFRKEQQSGRFPPEIELLYVSLPENIHNHVLEARRVASGETTPIAKRTGSGPAVRGTLAGGPALAPLR